MNLPNKLTILRLIFVPFYIFFLMMDSIIYERSDMIFFSHIALILFLLASFTDMLDGMIARKYGLITDFGKFADPLADKILVVSAMVCFVSLDRLPFWVCIIILAREFAISGFRLVVAGKGIVLAASKLGKSKTIFQMIMCSMMSFNIDLLAEKYGWPGVIPSIYTIIANIVMYIALLLTVISMIDYFYKNKSSFSLK